MKGLFKLAIKIFAVVVVISIGYGIYFYLKPMKEISGQKADYILTDTHLLDDFNTSPEKAQEKYKNKILEVSGRLKKTEIQDDANNVIFDNGGASIIVATCVSAEKDKVIKLIPGDMLKVKGIYKGFINGDDTFGTPAEIKMDQCTIVK